MKKFLIKFINVMMYSSFILAVIFLFILLSSFEVKGLEYAPSYGSPVPLHDSIEMIALYIFDSLNINFQPTQLQIFITLIAFFLLAGFILRFILKEIEYSQYSK